MEYLDVANNLENPELGKQKSSVLAENFILRETILWMEPPKKYFRLFPGNEVRLMQCIFCKVCTGYETDENGNVTVVHCTYDPETKSGTRIYRKKSKRNDPLGMRHRTAKQAEVRLYENLIDEEKGVYNKEDGSLNLNPNSLEDAARDVM